MVPRNLADPAYEPTDDDLRELMHRAFAAVTARQEAAEEQLRVRIAEARAVALRTARPARRFVTK